MYNIDVAIKFVIECVDYKLYHKMTKKVIAVQLGRIFHQQYSLSKHSHIYVC